jgi:galactose-1-phosphate uridylyltransferase
MTNINLTYKETTTIKTKDIKSTSSLGNVTYNSSVSDSYTVTVEGKQKAKKRKIESKVKLIATASFAPNGQLIIKVKNRKSVKIIPANLSDEQKEKMLAVAQPLFDKYRSKHGF